MRSLLLLLLGRGASVQNHHVDMNLGSAGLGQYVVHEKFPRKHQSATGTSVVVKTNETVAASVKKNETKASVKKNHVTAATTAQTTTSAETTNAAEKVSLLGFGFIDLLWQMSKDLSMPAGNGACVASLFLEPTDNEESSAAASSTAYQDFKRNYPRYPAYPNSQDRKALNFILSVGFLFFFGLALVILQAFEQIEGYVGGFRPNMSNIIPLCAPFLLLWSFNLFVICTVWRDPMREHNETRQAVQNESKMDTCSEMIGYLTVAVFAGLFDLTVQVYYRMNSSVELRSFAFASTLAHLSIHIWGGFLATKPGHDSYCKPLLSYTVLITCTLMILILGTYVAIYLGSYVYAWHQKKIAKWTERFGEAEGEDDSKKEKYAAGHATPRHTPRTPRGSEKKILGNSPTYSEGRVQRI